jgi:ribulose-5-phosphate 4-epimerase/fuculose-1-phosphate aldolase
MEFHLHSAVYRARPDVNAVAHTHPLWSTLFSSVGQAIMPVTMQAAVMGAVQAFDKTASINNRPLAEELARASGPHRVITLRSHGAVTGGPRTSSRRSCSRSTSRRPRAANTSRARSERLTCSPPTRSIP